MGQWGGQWVNGGFNDWYHWYIGFTCVWGFAWWVSLVSLGVCVCGGLNEGYQCTLGCGYSQERVCIKAEYLRENYILSISSYTGESMILILNLVGL